MPTSSSQATLQEEEFKMFEVKFYTLPNGKSPIQDFMDSSQKSLRTKISRQIKYLREFGLTRENPDLRKISGTSLWEVRILGRDSTRIICVIVIYNRIIILHIFRKKSNKTPLSEIDLALKRWKTIDK